MQRYTAAGKPYVTLSLAVQPKGVGAPEWVQVSVFEPLLAELPDPLLRGDRCYCEGKARVKRWQSKNGANKASLQITATRFEVLDRIGRRGKKRTKKHDERQVIDITEQVTPDLDETIPF